MVAKWDLYDEMIAANLIGNCGCLQLRLDGLLELFNTIDFTQFDNLKPSTPQIREKIDPFFSEEEWSQGVLITSDFPSGVNRANYEVDFQIQFQCSEYAVPHQISLELAFDNRQALGSNILKMDSANRYFTETKKGVSLSIIVVTTAANRVGHWDPAVAIDHEYSWALRKAYAAYFKTAILLLTIS